MGDGSALGREVWDKWAASLSAELSVEINWCPLGFEVPDGKGGLVHTMTADGVRTILGGTQ